MVVFGRDESLGVALCERESMRAPELGMGGYA
jgi:hypothetical protein